MCQGGCHVMRKRHKRTVSVLRKMMPAIFGKPKVSHISITAKNLKDRYNKNASAAIPILKNAKSWHKWCNLFFTAFLLALTAYIIELNLFHSVLVERGLSNLILQLPGYDSIGKILFWTVIFWGILNFKISKKEVVKPNKTSDIDEEELKYLRSVYLDFSNSLRKKNSEIEEVNEQLKTVLRSVPDGVFTTDVMGHILLWNKGAEKITGWTAEEVLGRPYQSILCLACKENSSFTDVVGEPLSDLKDLYITTKNRTHIPVEFVSSPVYSFEGEVREIVRVLRDITRQKEIDRFKDDFIAMVTHDLRSPLSSILGYANLLLNPKANAKEETRFKYTTAIIRACKGLSFFLNNLLDSARLEAGVMTFHMEHFLINDILTEVWELFHPLSQEKGVLLTFDNVKDSYIFGDREKIKQVLVNLLANAMKFTSPGGEIELKVKQGETRVELLLRDTGRGIPEDEQPRLFQKFMQVKGERVGTGLGLFIVRNIIEGHCGEIWVESKLGEGTAFHILLSRGDRLKSSGFTEETRHRKFS